MSNRKQRAEIAKETLDILERGNYQNRAGKIIDLTDAITAAKSRSIHYTPDSLQMRLPFMPLGD